MDEIAGNVRPRFVRVLCVAVFALALKKLKEFDVGYSIVRLRWCLVLLVDVCDGSGNGRFVLSVWFWEAAITENLPSSRKYCRDSTTRIYLYVSTDGPYIRLNEEFR